MSTPEPTPAPQAPRRQYVNFAFYKADPAWRRLPESERAKGKQEFIRAVEEYTGKVLVVAYSSVGIRAIATSCCGGSATNWNCSRT